MEPLSAKSHLTAPFLAKGLRAAQVALDSASARNECGDSGFRARARAARTVRQLSDDAGNFDIAWMPGQTHVAYFTAAGALMIQDITSLARRGLTVSLPLPA